MTSVRSLAVRAHSLHPCGLHPGPSSEAVDHRPIGEHLAPLGLVLPDVPRHVGRKAIRQTPVKYRKSPPGGTSCSPGAPADGANHCRGLTC